MASVLQLVRATRSAVSPVLLAIIQNLEEIERRNPHLLIRYAEQTAYDLRVIPAKPHHAEIVPAAPRR